MQPSEKKNKIYDIILVYGISRAHNYYLNIVKYLSQQFKIGIYMVPAEKRGSEGGAKQMIKVKQTDEQFLSCLKSFGADILDEGVYSCNLLVFPQANFNPEFVKGVDKKIKRNNAIALQTFSYGMNMLKAFSEIGIKKLLVFEKTMFYNRIYSDEDRSFIKDNFEIIEMGSPYKKYPVFEGIEIDYLIAFPTSMLLKNSFHRNKYLSNVLTLLNDLGSNNKVVLKHHNVRDKGNRLFSSTNNYFLKNVPFGSVLKGYQTFTNLPESLAQKNILLAKVEKKFTAFANSVLESKVLLLSSMTPYYNFGAEHFLPFVKKGLITGISSTTWYALRDRLPVYNCDDQPFDEDRIANGDCYKSFYVDPCQGRLEFNSENFKKIPDSAVEADLIQLIRKEL